MYQTRVNPAPNGLAEPGMKNRRRAQVVATICRNSESPARNYNQEDVNDDETVRSWFCVPAAFSTRVTLCSRTITPVRIRTRVTSTRKESQTGATRRIRRKRVTASACLSHVCLVASGAALVRPAGHGAGVSERLGWDDGLRGVCGPAFDQVNAMRSCSACSCAPPLGSTCSATLAVYADPACAEEYL